MNGKLPLEFKYNPRRCIKLPSPIFNYFSSTYMTIISVFESLIIGLIIMALSENYYKNTFNFKVLLIAIQSIIFSVMFWHKYINHHQFIGWMISWIDTLIVFSFGLIQVFFYFGIKEQNPKITFLVIISGLFFGIFAYVRSYKQLSKKHNEEFYDSLIRCLEKDCRMGYNLYKWMIQYELSCIKGTIKHFIIQLILTLAVYNLTFDKQIINHLLNFTIIHSYSISYDSLIISLALILSITSLLIFFIDYDIDHNLPKDKNFKETCLANHFNGSK